MALAFPKTSGSALAPLGAAALFWAWYGAAPKRAFWLGWLAGTVYFAMTFWWFGETAGALIAPFGFLLALGPAIGDAFFGFALVGVAVSFAAAALRSRSRAARALVPLAAAAAFALGEWVRGEALGEIAVPFGNLGYTQAGGPLAALAAFAGVYGVTFAIALGGAYLAYAVRMRAVRASGADAGIALGTLAALAALLYAAWPARTLPPATFRVAAVQGDIAQAVKFTPQAFATALRRYESLSASAAAFRPQLVLWPETVIPVALDRYPALESRFGELARRLRTTLVVGTLSDASDGEYNVLDFFAPDGRLESQYRKRRLVPFAEHLPAASLLAWAPWTRNVSHFGEGTSPGIVRVGAQRFGPVICWESAFSDLAGDDVRDGASALLVATDDAWFGTTAGPYQHAQIAQMRAIETGRWIVRAASTGISGIVAPDGRYVASSHPTAGTSHRRHSANRRSSPGESAHPSRPPTPP